MASLAYYMTRKFVFCIGHLVFLGQPNVRCCDRLTLAGMYGTGIYVPGCFLERVDQVAEIVLSTELARKQFSLCFGLSALKSIGLVICGFR